MNIVVVDCPKDNCDGKMVPLSGSMYEGTIKKMVPLAEWRCVKCKYRVEAY